MSTSCSGTGCQHSIPASGGNSAFGRFCAIHFNPSVGKLTTCCAGMMGSCEPPDIALGVTGTRYSPNSTTSTNCDVGLKRTTNRAHGIGTPLAIWFGATPRITAGKQQRSTFVQSGNGSTMAKTEVRIRHPPTILQGDRLSKQCWEWTGCGFVVMTQRGVLTLYQPRQTTASTVWTCGQQPPSQCEERRD